MRSVDDVNRNTPSSVPLRGPRESPAAREEVVHASNTGSVGAAKNAFWPMKFPWRCLAHAVA
eukprot:6654120-Pyramimonas_sp.AAC.1